MPMIKRMTVNEAMPVTEAKTISIGFFLEASAINYSTFFLSSG
jgi:hypothetical protein